SLALFYGLTIRATAGDRVSCMLDWFPNPDHAPLYLAQAKGFFAEEGLEVDLMVPADPNDPLKLVAAGKVNFAISYQPSVITARSEGLPVVSIGALVQHPLSSILYLESSGFKSPADLKGRRIGYSVEPLYRVLFEAVAEKAGLQASDYEIYRVGFNLAPSLLTGKVDAVVGAFRNYEAIQIELEGKKVGIFPLEEHGIPDFYELVIITHPNEITAHPTRVKAFMRGLTKGIQQTIDDPKACLETFLKLHPDLRDELNRRAFQATLPFFKGSPEQKTSRWVEMQTFMFERGLIRRASPVEELIWSGN
ncbi:MAG: ABC transporter substrate-binding protein, partial [Syntrophobacterales bacterium]